MNPEHEIIEVFADMEAGAVKVRLRNGTTMTLEEHAAFLNQATEQQPSQS